jgi:hypothetical protein
LFIVIVYCCLLLFIVVGYCHLLFIVVYCCFCLFVCLQEYATEDTQRYKEGRVILERALITETGGFDDSE